MPQHTPEDVARRLAENRTTGGNQGTSKLRGAFRTARKKVRGGLNVAGKFARAAIAETSGGLREFGRGLTGREATPAGGGPGPAAGAPKATRAQQVAAKLTGRTGGVAGDAARAGTAGIEVTQDRPPTRAATSKLAQTGRVVRGAGRIAGPLGVGLSQAADIATESIGSLPARFLRLNPLTAGPTMQVDKALRLARGESALEATVEPALSGLQAASGGLLGRGGVEVGEESPLNITGPTASQTPLQLAGIGGQDEQQPPAAAGLRGAQFDETGARSFTNEDIGGGAINRGTASLAENQAVAQRLGARGQAERAAGLRAAAPGQPGQADPTATRLAGGGLASAFGSLALSGNQLRREAAERTRGAAAAASAAETRQKSDLDLRNKLTEIGARSAADKAATATQDAVGLAESVNEAIDSGDPNQVANVRSAIFQSFEQDPNDGATRAAMSNLIAEDIRDNTESGFFGALFNPFGAGRGPVDLLKSGGQGGFNNDFQDALNKVVLNQSTGELEIANPDGSGERQFLANLNDLSPETRQALLAFGLQTEGAGQPVTRGQGLRGDPNVPAGT